MTTPSIKGTAFHSVVDDVNRLLAQQQLYREQVEVALPAAELRLLDEKISPAAWYPIASYARLVELLVEQEASGGAEAYLVGRGVRTAERLSAAGIYQQLDTSLERMGVRVGAVVVTLARVIYNFTSWNYEADSSAGFAIRVEEAAAFPDVARFTTQGFIQQVATQTAGHRFRVSSERPSPDLVLYHAARSDTDAGAGAERDPAAK
ncbi:MAG: hypothetical protein OEM05_16665 [Myxococcales bacterium]|nr:hypothetical protein [Myxococcales bacterium]